MQFSLAKKLLRVGRLYHQLIASELPELRSDQDAMILSVLFSNNPTITQQQLAEVLNVDKSRITAMVFSLVQRGYVAVTRNDQDRREHHLHLTPLGSALIPKIQFVIDRANDRINRKIDGEMLVVFYSALRQMEENLLKEPESWLHQEN